MGNQLIDSLMLAAILQEVLSVHSIEKANFRKVRLFIEILPELLKLTEFRVLRKGVKVRVSLFRQVLELKLPGAIGGFS